MTEVTWALNGKAGTKTLGCQGPKSEPLRILNISANQAEFGQWWGREGGKKKRVCFMRTVGGDLWQKQVSRVLEGGGGVGKRNEKMNKTCSPRPRGGRRVNHRRAGRERSEAAGRVTLNGLGMCPRAWALFGIPTITSRVTLSKSLMFWKPPFLQL